MANKNQKIIILGAGLAGCIASHALRQYNPIIIDRETPTALAGHKAVMRMRDLNIALMLGLPARRVVVQKAIWSDGSLRLYSTLRDNNSYSIKTSGFVGSKSVLDLQQSERFLIPIERIKPASPVKRKEITIKSSSLRGLLSNNSEEELYDFCISTIPMPTICKIVGINIKGKKFEHSKITVLHYHINTPINNVFQTIYYPDSNIPLYRASLHENKLIAEIAGTVFVVQDITNVLKNSFGIPLSNSPEVFTQNNGKMHPIDEQLRKKIIYTLTERFNIFSFGRYAIWKPIRADHLIKDIIFIQNLIESKSNYDIIRKGIKNED